MNRPSAPGPTQIATSRTVLARGRGVHPLTDLYHWLMKTGWTRFISLCAVSFLLLNALFALGYWLQPGAIATGKPHTYLDCFFFSVQTMGTIGYGSMYPNTLWAHVLVVIEAFVGILNTAVITGLTFAKFARPTSRVLFSKVAVVAKREGVPSLMFRMANERANQIVEAQLHVVVARSEVTAEGERVRRFHDLLLSRERSIIFTLTWTAIHAIDEKSPLYGYDAARLAASNVEIIASLIGMDDTFSQQVSARHSYLPSEIRFGHRLADILTQLPDGTRWIDYEKFHDTVPVDEGGAPSA